MRMVRTRHSIPHTRICAILFCIQFVFTASDAYSADKKHAFVVGIGAYDHLQNTFQLDNPVNDSNAIADTFTQLDYKVSHHKNLKLQQFYDEFDDFIATVSRNDTVVFFLSGHGIEIDGKNYLLPSDVPQAKYGQQNKLRRRSISISELLTDIRAKSPAQLVLILDACRTHPLIPPEFTKAFPGQEKAGLVKQEGVQGEHIMYSAGSGQSALDKLNADDPIKLSVYVRHLIPLIKTPALELGNLNDQLKKQVFEETKTVGHTQIPVDSDQIIGNFCFAGCAAVEDSAVKAKKSGVASNDINETPQSAEEQDALKEQIAKALTNEKAATEQARKENVNLAKKLAEMKATDEATDEQQELSETDQLLIAELKAAGLTDDEIMELAAYGAEETDDTLQAQSDELIALVDVDIANWRLSSPPGNNAIEKLVLLESINPVDWRIQAKLEEITKIFITLSLNALALGNYADYEAYDFEARAIHGPTYVYFNQRFEQAVYDEEQYYNALLELTTEENAQAIFTAFAAGNAFANPQNQLPLGH